MGLSVWNQVDNRKYFSLSTINRKLLKEYGINVPVITLKKMARETPPFTQIVTGSDRGLGQQRITNIYRYEDFIPNKGGDQTEEDKI